MLLHQSFIHDRTLDANQDVNKDANKDVHEDANKEDVLDNGVEMFQPLPPTNYWSCFAS
jgi:hypothetical protein